MEGRNRNNVQAMERIRRMEQILSTLRQAKIKDTDIVRDKLIAQMSVQFGLQPSKIEDYIMTLVTAGHIEEIDEIIDGKEVTILKLAKQSKLLK